ncbi:hypothetical protein AB8B21_00890 [Tardiphaga sp. 866_E4_N2_1]|jgi:hypothetical protein|uniref:hypothetical protein n=1 Tax=unclassified Tardiphaga TaxID=2631404 RepID=UPI003F23A9D6
MPRDPVSVWAEQTVKVWPESYWLIDLAPEQLSLALHAIEASESHYACVIRDQTGFCLTIDLDTWAAICGGVEPRQKFGPLRVISTDSPLPFDVVGFIRAALEEVNGAGYKAAPQCGAASDHFFTGEGDIEIVKSLFEKLIAKAKTGQKN